ncbi:hypothetical protein P171DRAFT_400076 [Karstenula rhodostoma CBS 690.94]|uniref:Uncharacterized protein n=1 Tax=Karstenula rhodostoma CBS 690.94 TaxID=1392251 RepID=A0A9P4P6B3_9PLEO|nr:hypothetical protein P171DRAFT_400076 [Karstenula rhodostoma CBS 690.94]
MDIHKWLSETVLPHQPPSPPGQEEEHHVPCSVGPERAPKEQRRRKRGSSDSSLLAALQHDKGQPSAPSVGEEADETGHTDASHSASRSERSVSSKPYRRKPRHKTRPERYEPLSKDAKERGLHAQRRDGGESNKERRKSRRKKASKSGSGLVQSFQAKNVPRDRLTLKPREKLGLFNKGRVSSPVKGRGLPDLVFSEMRFLQKHKGKAEVGPPPGSPRKKRKKDQAHVKEDEISAYFTSVRPTLAEQDLNVHTKKPSHRKLRDASRSLRQPSSVVDQAILTVEPADQTSYPGSGGRGPRHESGSYVSWPESVRVPSLTPAHGRVEAAKSSGQLDSTRGGRTGNNVGGEVLHSPPIPPITTRHLVDNIGGRFQVSSLPPTNERLSRSHSLPQHTSSPRRINLVDRAARRRTLEDVASPSSMPPFVSTHSGHRRHIPASRGHTHCVQPPDPTVHRDVSLDHETEPLAHDDLGQHTSSSLGRILQECNTAFHEKRIAEALQHKSQGPYPRVPVQSNMRQTPEAYPTVRRIPSVRFAGVDELYYPAVPKVAGPSLYERQEEELYGHADQLFYEEGALPPPQDMHDVYFDEEAFDYAEQDWDDEAELADDGVGADPPVNEADVHHLDGNIADRVHGRAGIVAKPGFWRPHKLY